LLLAVLTKILAVNMFEKKGGGVAQNGIMDETITQLCA
jgi:hypothetical protein